MKMLGTGLALRNICHTCLGLEVRDEGKGDLGLSKWVYSVTRMSGLGDGTWVLRIS